MKKPYKVILLFSLTVFVVILSLTIVYIQKRNHGDNEIIFYYGVTCPHCKVVENYINENGIKQKLNITEKEVYNNQANLMDLYKKARECNIRQEDIGIPFIYYSGSCFMGEEKCIEFLRERLEVVS